MCQVGNGESDDDDVPPALDDLSPAIATVAPASVAHALASSLAAATSMRILDIGGCRLGELASPFAPAAVQFDVCQLCAFVFRAANSRRRDVVASGRCLFYLGRGG